MTIKNITKTSIRYIITAFLVVGITQVLLYFKIIGDSFVEQAIAAFISLIIVTMVLYAATR